MKYKEVVCSHGFGVDRTGGALTTRLWFATFEAVSYLKKETLTPSFLAHSDKQLRKGSRKRPKNSAEKKHRSDQSVFFNGVNSALSKAYCYARPIERKAEW